MSSPHLVPVPPPAFFRPMCADLVSVFLLVGTHHNAGIIILFKMKAITARIQDIETALIIHNQ